MGLIMTTIQSKDMFIFVSGDQEIMGMLTEKILEMHFSLVSRE